MKVKEIDRTVNTAWSPGDHHPILLAAGTAAQQLDASFNTAAALEIFALNLTDPSLDLELKYSIPSQHRYHKLAWGGEGPGVIVGGCDNGVIQMYNVSKLLTKEDGLIANPERHTGAVKSLDFNPFQRNLLATGATNSEIFIWDMNNTSTPMSPGSKSQPLEDVAWLAWNKQVQHILASTFPTRNVVWDLRKNEPIIKLTDATTRVRWKVVAWHPEVATQLCLASEEDSNPVVQLWDLRFATSPLKTFSAHTKGVLSLAWCSQDPDLLISSGKDNKILCWNPNSNNPDGEVVCEIPNSQQWIFEVSWCPRNPSLIASSSCDGHTSLYSITGSPATHLQTNNKIADSFPGMGEAHIPDPHLASHHPQSTVDLKKAPKWLRRPVGATFGFGGKLASFGSNGVRLFEVQSEPDFLERARALGDRLSSGKYAEICRGKADPLWRYLEASFGTQPRTAIRTLLGFNKEQVSDAKSSPKPAIQNNTDSLTDQFSNLANDDSSHLALNGNGDIFFDRLSAQSTPEKATPFSISVGNDVDGKVCKALLAGSILEAINISLTEDRMADALVLSVIAGADVLSDTQRKYFQKREGPMTHLLRAIVTEDWRPVVMSCELTSWKEALAALLTYCTDDILSHLCYDLGQRLEEAGGEFSTPAEICYVASGNIAPLIEKRITGAALTSDNIQELVELVLVAQAALSSRGQCLPVVGEVARILVMYAELLADQGDLDSALSYVNNSQDEVLVGLRERLYFALGHKSVAPSSFQPGPQPQQHYPATQQHHQQPPPAPVQHQQQRSQSRKTSLSFQTSAPLANSYNSQPMQPGTPYGGVSSQQPPVATQPPLARPPPPSTPVFGGSTSAALPAPSHQGSGVMAVTKKYVVDPSVASGGAGGYPRSGTPLYSAPAAPGQPVYPHHQPPAPASAPTAHNYGSSFGAQPGFQSSSAVPPMSSASIFSPPQSQASIFNPPQPNQQQPFGNPSAGVGGSQPNTMVSAQHGSASGWNDPPSVTPRSQSSAANPVNQNPITHPLFGAAPASNPQQLLPFQQQQQQQMMPGMPPPQQQQQTLPGMPPQQHPGMPPQQQMQHSGMSTQQHPGMPPQQHSAVLPSQHPGVPPQQHPGMPQQFSQQEQRQPFIMSQPQPLGFPPSTISNQSGGGYNERAQGAVETPKQKPPVPQQYAHIQTCFEDLRNKCALAATSNQLMRRKLEDVSKKLESLYDSLREEKLSGPTIEGLEDLVKCVGGSDYQGGLVIVTRMVSGSDFSQIASFMTGLKILLQTAQQLRV